MNNVTINQCPYSQNSRHNGLKIYAACKMPVRVCSRKPLDER